MSSLDDRTRSSSAHPHRLGETFRIAARPPLNPLAFFATSLAFSGAIEHALRRLLHQADDDAGSLVQELFANAWPYTVYLAVGALCHDFVSRHGRRPPLRGSTGLALYAGGAVPALLRVSDHVGDTLWHRVAPEWRYGADVVIYVAFLLILSSLLAGLHHVSRWRAVWAVIASYVALMIVGTTLVGVVLSITHVLPHIPR